MTYEFFDFTKIDDEYINILKELTPNDVSKLDSFLQTSGMDFFQNESTVINLPINTLWDMIFDFSLLKTVYPIQLNCLIHINEKGENDKADLKSNLKNRRNVQTYLPKRKLSDNRNKRYDQDKR